MEYTLICLQAKRRRTILYCSGMARGFLKIPLLFPCRFFRKKKKTCSTSQLQFHIENTPASIEAYQILFALQHLASNSNSANFSDDINRSSKVQKQLLTTMPTFYGKIEKFEVFEDLFQTSLKKHIQLTGDKINYFYSLMKEDELQTFENISSANREKLGKILAVFRRNNVKPQSMATAKK